MVLSDHDLGAALLDGLRRANRLPRWLNATVALSAGGATFVLRIDRGAASLGHAESTAPDTRLSTDSATLCGLAEGSVSGLEAFLDGRLAVRGNLALSLRLAGMWPQPAADGRGLRSSDTVVDRLRTFHLDAGDGPPVVLLHGLGATNASMLPTFTALAPTHRVIAPDLPGFGDSAHPLRPLHAAFYARWLIGLLDELGLDRVHLVGNSMGGRVAVETALRHPERVDRLALLAPSPAFLRGREHVRLVRLLRPELALVPLPLSRDAVLRSMRGMFARPDRLDAAWYDAAADEFLRVFSTARGRICFFSAARQIYLEEPHGPPGGFWQRLPALARPALFLWGDRDRLVPAKFARHVEHVLPRARSVILADCGHVPQFEQPQHTHELVRAFFKESTVS